jgi:serine protease Do
MLRLPSRLLWQQWRLSCSAVQVFSRRMSRGSGVIWQPDGLIITNAHVAQDEHVTVELADGRVMEAVRFRVDSRRDLAALRVEATDLPAVTVGDSDALRVGELVLAVGHPQGVVGALTTGIIHTTSSIDTPSGQRWVIADVRLAPGNSGGPLSNAQGQAIGINTMIADGLARAVPSKEVERFLNGANRPYLGVTLRPVSVLSSRDRFFGLLILEVAAHSLAMTAGLMLGDVIIGVGGQSFSTPDDLVSALEQSVPGESLRLEFLRNGRFQHTTVLPKALDVTDPISTGV